MSFDPEKVTRIMYGCPSYEDEWSTDLDPKDGWGTPEEAYRLSYVSTEDYDQLLSMYREQTALLHEVSSDADPAGTLRELRLAQATVKALEIENEELRGAAKADGERLINAAYKAKVIYAGCDTPDELAEQCLAQEVLIQELRAEIERLKR